MSTVDTTAPLGTRRSTATDAGAARKAGRTTRGNRSRRERPGWFLTLSAVVVFLCSIFPVYWMVNSSFLPTNRIRSTTPTFFPADGTFENYRKIFAGETNYLFAPALRVSLLVVLAVLVAALVFGFLAALAATRFRWRGRKVFIVTILAVQMIPGEAMIISLYSMLRDWNLLDQLFGLILVYTASVLPFTIWTLRGFVAGVPAELEEAAQIDGCSKIGAFVRVTFPLVAPGLISTGVFAFIQAWNEFVLALVVMESNKTLPIWLRALQEATKGTDWGTVMAGSTLISIPIVIFFLVVQGRMTSGMVSGAVKG
jgi:N,N'-diacetylchitobiose transport system permease protein